MLDLPWNLAGDGSFYQKHPDFTSTFVNKEGYAVHKPAPPLDPQLTQFGKQTGGRSKDVGQRGIIASTPLNWLNFLFLLRLMLGCPVIVVLAFVAYTCFGCYGLLLGISLILLKVRT
jgi:hypothetical protein